MSDVIAHYYLWVKALHVISVMAWMAGLFYLPRLFAYHVSAANGGELDTTLKTMEQRLLRIIMNPAMILSWIFGLCLIIGNPHLFDNGWMHVKFTAVILMTVFHMVLAKWRKVFERGENTNTEKFYKWWNEAPTVLMILIVIMAVAEPF